MMRILKGSTMRCLSELFECKFLNYQREALERDKIPLNNTPKTQHNNRKFQCNYKLPLNIILCYVLKIDVTIMNTTILFDLKLVLFWYYKITGCGLKLRIHFKIKLKGFLSITQ